MPAPIPAGYTRGPIMFIGPIESKRAETHLLQLFWQEAGSYGARILIVSTPGAKPGSVTRCTELLEAWESDTVMNLRVEGRRQAMDPQYTQDVEAATGILFAGEHLHLAGLLGGTPLAQAIRRANARSKAVCGMGSSAAYLCQHMLSTQAGSKEAGPFMHRHMIQFAPGLGLINQIVLDGDDNPAPNTPRRLARLLTAISYNPFLIGVDLGIDTGAIVYSDGTMEVFGAGTALVADGENVSYANTHERDRTREGEAQSIGILDVKLHILASEHTYNLRRRTSRPPDTSDIPRVTDAVKSAY